MKTFFKLVENLQASLYVMFPKCVMCNRKMPPFSPVQFLLPGEFSTILYAILGGLK